MIKYYLKSAKVYLLQKKTYGFKVSYKSKTILKMKNKIYFIIATLSMAIAIAFGALGAHALKEIFDVHALEAWKTAVFYQIVHSLAVLIILVVHKVYKMYSINLVLNLMISGFILFSTSIYLLSFNSVWGIESLGKILGPITPIGGLLMISSWIVFSVKIIKTKQ